MLLTGVILFILIILCEVLTREKKTGTILWKSAAAAAAAAANSSDSYHSLVKLGS